MDDEACVACGVCEERCPVEAIKADISYRALRASDNSIMFHAVAECGQAAIYIVSWKRGRVKHPGI